MKSLQSFDKKFLLITIKTMTSIQKISIAEENYPALLKEIPHAPENFYIWCKDEAFELFNKPAIAIVGTRRCSDYGRDTAKYFAQNLSQAGFVIVSGLARGIDEVAHTSTLEVKGKTIAVIGSGMDKKSLYPQENYALAERIVQEGGIVISEYKEGTPAHPFHFPARNRIVSGLSLGVVVIEAKEKSGALITANFALEHNREVFAVPGPIFHLNAKGPNSLIQKGAKLVVSLEDIIEEFPNLALHYKQEQTFENYETTSEEEGKIIHTLKNEPMTIDQIVQSLNLPITTISPILSVLEIKGIINKQDQKYILK